MKKTFVWIMITVFVVSMALFTGIGCKKEVTEETTAAATTAAAETTAAAKQVTIAVIPTISEHPWWIRVKWGCDEAAKATGANVIWNTFEQADAAKQMDTFNDMVNKGVDAIIIAAVDSEVVKQPIADAMAKGIAVFAFDVGAPGSNVVWFVSGLEPVSSGTTIGEGLAKEINYKGKVGLMLAQPGAEVHVKRNEAAKAVWAKYPDIELVGEYADNDDQEKGLAIWESVIQANPDIAGMAGCCTSNVAAACSAVSNAGLCGKVAIWGCGLPQQNAEFIKSGCAKGIFLMDPGEMAFISVKTAFDYVTENKLPKTGDEYTIGGKPNIDESGKVTYCKDFVFTPENVDDFGF